MIRTLTYQFFVFFLMICYVAHTWLCSICSVKWAPLLFRCSIHDTAVAAAIVRPARTRCQRGHRERNRISVARVSTVGASGRKRADYEKASTSSCSFYYDCSKKNTWLQYRKRQNQAPGTAFPFFFGDEVWMEDHANCCRFTTRTGVHQGAHICLAK